MDDLAPTFGMVLEHPGFRGLMVMVVAAALWEHRPGNRAAGRDGWCWTIDAVALSNPPRRIMSEWPVGSMQRISGKPTTGNENWMVVEP